MDGSGLSVFLFVAVWSVALLVLTMLPIVAAIKRRAWRSAAVVVLALCVLHAGFWLWAAPQAFKGTTLWSGVVIYLVAALAAPIVLWRFVRA